MPKSVLEHLACVFQLKNGNRLLRAEGTGSKTPTAAPEKGTDAQRSKRRAGKRAGGRSGEARVFGGPRRGGVQGEARGARGPEWLREVFSTKRGP